MNKIPKEGPKIGGHRLSAKMLLCRTAGYPNDNRILTIDIWLRRIQHVELSHASIANDYEMGWEAVCSPLIECDPHDVEGTGLIEAPIYHARKVIRSHPPSAKLAHEVAVRRRKRHAKFPLSCRDHLSIRGAQEIRHVGVAYRLDCLLQFSQSHSRTLPEIRLSGHECASSWGLLSFRFAP